MTAAACCASRPAPRSSVKARKRAGFAFNSRRACSASNKTDVLSTPPRKRESDGFVNGYVGKPVFQRLISCRDVTRAGLCQVSRTRRKRRSEKALIARRGVGAADLVKLDDVMRRNHPRISRIELPADALLLTPGEKLVNALADDEVRAVVQLRDEVTQRDANRARHPHRLAVALDGGKMSVGLTERVRIAAPHGIGDMRG